MKLKTGGYILPARYKRSLAISHHQKPVGAVAAHLEDLAAEGQLVSAILQGERRDTGTTLGYVQAFVEEALARDDLGPELRTWLKERL